MSHVVTVVTGATGALGSAVVDYLAFAGHRVAAVDLRGDATLSGALLVKLESNRLSAWHAAASRIEAELGPPTGAVLCAGGWAGGAPFHAEPNDEIWHSMLEANVESMRCALRALLPGLVARRRGSIVVIGSRAVDRPWESAGAAAYAATKSAVVTLARAVAAEVIDEGVRINAVLPSTIDTPANRQAMPDADRTRWVNPERLARVIGFLLSEDARDITGAALPIYARA